MSGTSVGAAPLIAQIHRRPKGHALRRELSIELLDESLDTRAAHRQAELRDLLSEECGALLFPRGLIAHASPWGQRRVPSPGKQSGGAAVRGAAG